MRSYLLALVVLAGCTPAPFTYGSDCITIDSNVELRQEGVDFYVAEAKSLFEGKFGAGEFCKTFVNTPILVHKEDTVTCPVLRAKTCAGGTWLDGSIDVARDGRPLLHELFHVWDQRHQKAGTMWHEGWKEEGLFDLDDLFSRTVSTPDLGGFWVKDENR